MARNDFEPLTWEEAEQNRRECLEEHFAQFPQTAPRQSASLREPTSQVLSESPSEGSDWLRSEIKRGREYLDQAEKDLAESRALLEGWPAYERVCGKNPLEHLTRSVMVNERITRFLAGWLQRREAQLTAMTRHGREPASLPRPQGRRVRRAPALRKELLSRSPKARLVA